MKNKHLLLIVATIAFLTYYVPVAIFSTYVAYLPVWTLPFFWTVVFIPFWFNELVWRTAPIAGATYLGFHELHFAGRAWKNHKANIWMIVSRFGTWYFTKIASWLSLIVTGVALWYGLTGSYFTVDGFFEETHPFVPYYISITASWITFIKYFSMFKERVNMGRIDYGQRTIYETRFSPEWYAEQERIRTLHQERLQKK